MTQFDPEQAGELIDPGVHEKMTGFLSDDFTRSLLESFIQKEHMLNDKIRDRDTAIYCVKRELETFREDFAKRANELDAFVLAFLKRNFYEKPDYESRHWENLQ